MALSIVKKGAGAAEVVAAALLLASGEIAQASSSFAPTSYIGGFDPELIWEVLIGGFVLASFTSAIALWATAMLRKQRRLQRRKNMLVDSVLNKLQQGVVIVDARNRLVFCNDRYLEMYGLQRSDAPYGIPGGDLLSLRRARGTLDVSNEEFLRNARMPEGYIGELPDGRFVQVKFSALANGGMISTHDDCTELRLLSKQLVTTKQFLESVIDNIPVCVAAKNIEDGRYILANRAFEKLSGMPRDRIIGATAEEIYSPRTATAVQDVDRLALDAGKKGFRTELTVEFGRRELVLETDRVVAYNDRNEPEFIIALFEDITDRQVLARELDKTRKFLELVVDNIPVGLTVQSTSSGRYLLANRGAEIILNRRREDAIGLTCGDIFNPKEARLIRERDELAVRKGDLMVEEHPISTRNGLRLFVTRRITVADEAGAESYLIKTHVDVTDRRQTEARMAHMAYHDGLTDLPNRTSFLKSLSQMIEACDAAVDEFAVLSVDLDGLSEINDVFGHAIGDQLLIEVASRIEQASQGGVVARLGGDEFGLLIDGPQPEAARRLAERVSKALARDFEIDGKTVRTGATTGIALFPRDGRDAASLLANASAALFRAKAHARGSIGLFAPEMDMQIRDRRALHQDLSNAIRNGELSLYYQPQAASKRQIGEGDIVGFEALARWRHPTRGFVPPGEFIPLAEESGLIVEIGEWILREACREAASWPKPLQIAVNLSPAQFLNTDLVATVHQVLVETGLQPGRLELEITEGVLIDDFDRGLALLRRLKTLGVRVSMDDFGSGYSSLTYLQAFPFDKIKIDRAFIMHLGRNVQSAAIVRAVIGLGHGLGVSLVAEGVETQEQLDFLVDEGCDAVQGYLIGMPAPIDQYPVLVGLAPSPDPMPARARQVS
ncbi:diguanylate cyclase/phosphodiesterase [Rhodopseudomonas palustris HaA2]|uniref:Diguanylate cyclase/phosphodiesterase n=1 Tax=Rhodopseudomonas palustris (strain HaA2) TaxID=316058 RepID=Q2J048_RHOP2|nr:EAL domain-containing protein [Rhodopseudomonas palustris]ABD06162.1 diguanylate cyclase/phosphodiesterase [Rhodopseudomonas palustris HaA2]